MKRATEGYVEQNAKLSGGRLSGGAITQAEADAIAEAIRTKQEKNMKKDMEMMADKMATTYLNKKEAREKEKDREAEYKKLLYTINKKQSKKLKELEARERAKEKKERERLMKLVQPAYKRMKGTGGGASSMKIPIQNITIESLGRDYDPETITPEKRVELIDAVEDITNRILEGAFDLLETVEKQIDKGKLKEPSKKLMEIGQFYEDIQHMRRLLLNYDFGKDVINLMSEEELAVEDEEKRIVDKFNATLREKKKKHEAKHQKKIADDELFALEDDSDEEEPLSRVSSKASIGSFSSDEEEDEEEPPANIKIGGSNGKGVLKNKRRSRRI